MNESRQAPLTIWRGKREGPVKTVKESKCMRGTHILERGDGGTSQNTKRKRHRERWAHTNWGV